VLGAFTSPQRYAAERCRDVHKLFRISLNAIRLSPWPGVRDRGLLRWKGQFRRTVRDAMRMAAPMINAQPGASQPISEGLSLEPIGISRDAPTNGTCPDVRLFLSLEQCLTGTTLQADWRIVDRVLGQVSSTFGKVCQAFRPCALSLAKSRLAFFA
jgi:hypothetical protein